MSDEWLEQLHQLHEADKAQHQAEAKKKQQQVQRNPASDLLRQSKAHELLRQVQRALLGGQGTLDIFDRAGDYERVITLAWQGTISAADRPDPDDPKEYNYILVGVRQGKLWVNGKQVPSATPEALKVALLKASKNPGREKRGKYT
jgi:hypothetical protein